MNKWRNGMLVALVWCLGTTGIEAQSLVINEVLASNSSFDYDDFFQFEDWIEIYNGGGILNLEGYHLSDDPDTLDKWMFPSTNPGLTTILPGGHLRIWCDDDEQPAGYALPGYARGDPGGVAGGAAATARAEQGGSGAVAVRMRPSG